AAGDATKSMPPNVPEFDGAHDGGNDTPQPCGRNGLFPIPLPSTSGSINNNTLLITALIASLKRGCSRSCSHSPSHAGPSAPVKHCCEELAVFSSSPEPGTEIDACLQDFAHVKKIDMIGTVLSLQELELTPDIISQVPVSRLCEVTKAWEGHVIKLQQFCTSWQARYEVKLEAHTNQKSHKN
ncbi:hypothetical protein H0H92_008914, partial [Tricholoma furcatifolium]